MAQKSKNVDKIELSSRGGVAASRAQRLKGPQASRRRIGAVATLLIPAVGIVGFTGYHHATQGSATGETQLETFAVQPAIPSGDVIAAYGVIVAASNACV